MAKLKMPADAAKALTVPERLLLLCVASAIDFKHAKIAEKVVTEVLVKGLIERAPQGISRSRTAGGSCSGQCCRTYDGLVGLYPNNRLPASVGPDGKAGPIAVVCRSH
jgi:hypothetical protein